MDINRIERDIFIEALPEKVWKLVKEPAWWVGENGPDYVQIDGKRIVAETNKYGIFPVLIETVDPPSYIACRWASAFSGEEPRKGNSTRIEFSLTPENGGTRLRVVESGFAHLDAPENKRNEYLEENTEGWVQQLDRLKRQAE